MKYAIDGSNALLGLRLDKKPSIRLFSKLLLTLRQRGDEFNLFFDNSIQQIMAREGLSIEWAQFTDALKRENIRPTFAPRVDPRIEKYCSEHSAAVINSTDKMDSWNYRPPVHRARVHRKGNSLQVTLMDDATGQFVFCSPAHESFTLGNTTFPALNPAQVVLERTIAPDTDARASSNVTEGTLLVLALDASGSMTEANSYDGRPKSEHLNEVVKKAVTRLRHSKINDGLYVAVLRFENDVTPMLCPATGTMFASIYDWHKTILRVPSSRLLVEFAPRLFQAQL